MDACLTHAVGFYLGVYLDVTCSAVVARESPQLSRAASRRVYGCGDTDPTTTRVREIFNPNLYGFSVKITWLIIVRVQSRLSVNTRWSTLGARTSFVVAIHVSPPASDLKIAEFSPCRTVCDCSETSYLGRARASSVKCVRTQKIHNGGTAPMVV